MGARDGTGKKDAKFETYQFVIAVIIVLPLAVIMAILTYTARFSDAGTVLSSYGALVGAVLGFYFGQKPGQSIAQQAVQQSQATASNADQALEDANAKVASQAQEIEKIKSQLYALKTTLS